MLPHRDGSRTMPDWFAHNARVICRQCLADLQTLPRWIANNGRPTGELPRVGTDPPGTIFYTKRGWDEDLPDGHGVPEYTTPVVQIGRGILIDSGMRSCVP